MLSIAQEFNYRIKSIFKKPHFDLLLLPEELTLKIFQEMSSDQNEVFKLSLLNKEFNRFVNDKTIWEKLSIEKGYPLLPTMDWQTSYQHIEREMQKLTQIVDKTIIIDERTSLYKTECLKEFIKECIQLRAIEKAIKYIAYMYTCPENQERIIEAQARVTKKYLQLFQRDKAIEYTAQIESSLAQDQAKLEIFKDDLQKGKRETAIGLIAQIIDSKIQGQAQVELVKDSLQKKEKDNAIEQLSQIDDPKAKALAQIEVLKVYPDPEAQDKVSALTALITNPKDKALVLIESVKVYPKSSLVAQKSISIIPISENINKAALQIKLYKSLAQDKVSLKNDTYLNSVLAIANHYVLYDTEAFLNDESLKDLVEIYLQREEKDRVVELIDSFLTNNNNLSAALTQIAVVKTYPNEGEIYKANCYIDNISNLYEKAKARIKLLRVLVKIGNK